MRFLRGGPRVFDLGSGHRWYYRSEGSGSLGMGHIPASAAFFVSFHEPFHPDLDSYPCNVPAVCAARPTGVFAT